MTSILKPHSAQPHLLCAVLVFLIPGFLRADQVCLTSGNAPGEIITTSQNTNYTCTGGGSFHPTGQLQSHYQRGFLALHPSL